MFNVESLRSDFPILQRQIHGQPLVYLDNGASAQKPKPVIDAINRTYREEYSNVHRGLHYLSNITTDRYEEVRSKIKIFLNAHSDEEIIFTTGTTHGINLVAYSWGEANLQAGDEIILSVMEHHSNIVPWHFLRERIGCVLKWAIPDSEGNLDPQSVIDLISSRTSLIALTQTSNVLGTIVDIGTIAKHANERDIPVLVDASQAAVHMKIDVQELGVDFLAITGHKLYGPSASGALFISEARARECRPFFGGGDMIEEVTRKAVSYANPPHKFEAGTPPIVQIIGLGAALDYISAIGIEAIHEHEQKLIDYTNMRFSELEWLQVHGNPAKKAAIFSFLIDSTAHAHDLSTILDQMGIAVRAGHHCAQPLMEHLGVTATCRASLAMYNTIEEIDALIDGLKRCYKLFS